MSENFDPYHEWLGIPATEQPPNHYRLLAIPAFEESPTVIESAADRQMAHLRTFQMGQHSAESQRLLNELAAARVCLLNPQKKAAYDQRLRQKLAPSTRPVARAEDRPPVPVVETRRPSASATASGALAKKPRPKPTVLVGAVVLAVPLIGLALWWAVGRGGTASDAAQAKADPITSARAATDVVPKPRAQPEKEPSVVVATKPKDEVKPEIPPAAPPSELPDQTAVAKTQPEPDKIADAQPAASAPSADKPEPIAQPAVAKKIEPPSAEQQKRLMAEIDEVYKPGAAKRQAAKLAVAHKLLEDGRKNEANRNEQFVLLRRAGEIARDAGDGDLMLEAVDAMAAAGFEIQPTQVKVRLLKGLVEKVASAHVHHLALGEVSNLSAVSATCVKLAEQAASVGAIDEAIEVLDAARDALAEPSKRAQSAQRTAQTAMRRARSPADKAAREEKAAEAQAELDAIAKAQSAVAECAKGLQHARREQEALQAARERLKVAPDDPNACLEVGRWQCFSEGNWDAGLKLLAKGSDAALKSLAAEELASQPSRPDERVARGDAWWDLAEKGDANAKAAMRQRAGQWYQEALPDLAPGLGKLRVEKRLAQAAEGPSSKAADDPAHSRPPLAVAPFDEYTAKKLQARWAKHLGVPLVQTNSIGMKFVLIPPGEFEMGSSQELVSRLANEAISQHAPAWYLERLPHEAPSHHVRITKPFYMSVYEVTQADYTRVIGSNPSKFQGDTRRPVEEVGWNDAVEFCRRLSELPAERTANREYRLPTEAQWEYACRAGSITRYSFGDDETLLTHYGWFNGNSGGQTHPVGEKRPNAFGLYDMHGNVWEWCEDWMVPSYYTNSPADDPAGPPSGRIRVDRGGRWRDPAAFCRSAVRDDGAPGRCDDCLGMRVCVPATKADNHVTLEGGSHTRASPPLAIAPFDQGAAKQYQMRWAKHLGVPVLQTNSVGMKLALVPPGEFMMGSPKAMIEGELRRRSGDGWYRDRLPGEGPQHRVRITQPFYLGVTEVTQEEYQSVMGSNPSKFQGDPKRPVEQVSWDDAVEFCRRLSELPAERVAKRRYGLPTEAQWEYACRAGSAGPWCYSPNPGALVAGEGERLLDQYGWFNANAAGETHPVAQKRPNAWGLYDMYGNVWEWCQDWYDKEYYVKSAIDDPTGPDGGSARVIRGGCWDYPAGHCRSANRSHPEPKTRFFILGLRLSLVFAK